MKDKSMEKYMNNERMKVWMNIETNERMIIWMSIETNEIMKVWI